MNNKNNPGNLNAIVVATGRLEDFSRKIQQQALETQAEILATREQEEIRFKAGLIAMHQEQLKHVKAALRPSLIRGWQMLAALAAIGVVLFTGFLMLLNRADGRLRSAEARAEAAELRADVQEALQYLDITSCAGRPCIRIDRHTPKWKSGNVEYVLADEKR